MTKKATTVFSLAIVGFAVGFSIGYAAMGNIVSGVLLGLGLALAMGASEKLHSNKE